MSVPCPEPRTPHWAGKNKPVDATVGWGWRGPAPGGQENQVPGEGGPLLQEALQGAQHSQRGGSRHWASSEQPSRLRSRFSESWSWPSESWSWPSESWSRSKKSQQWFKRTLNPSPSSSVLEKQLWRGDAAAGGQTRACGEDRGGHQRRGEGGRGQRHREHRQPDTTQPDCSVPAQAGQASQVGSCSANILIL